MRRRVSVRPAATISDPGWAGTTHLAGDLAAAVSELKAAPGGELLHGSATLVRWLLAHDLVDELQLLILGQGARLFPDDGPDIALDLLESRTDAKGVTIQIHRPAGRPRYPA